MSKTISLTDKELAFLSDVLTNFVNTKSNAAFTVDMARDLLSKLRK